MLRRVVWQKFTDVTEMLTASFLRAMSHTEAASNFETTLNLYQTTRRSIPEDIFEARGGFLQLRNFPSPADGVTVLLHRLQASVFISIIMTDSHVINHGLFIIITG
jgi:hypothetical protein